MKSYFFTTSTVIHSSLIHINVPGVGDGGRETEREGERTEGERE